jgi:hypothetical protein
VSLLLLLLLFRISYITECNNCYWGILLFLFTKQTVHKCKFIC